MSWLTRSSRSFSRHGSSTTVGRGTLCGLVLEPWANGMDTSPGGSDGSAGDDSLHNWLFSVWSIDSNMHSSIQQRLRYAADHCDALPSAIPPMVRPARLIFGGQHWGQIFPLYRPGVHFTER